MYKKVIIFVILSLLLAVPIKAHLTGAFADFLAIVYDETTIAKLHNEMNQTKAEIEELIPKVSAAEKEFEENQKIAVDQLQFYSEAGLDTWYAMIHQGSDVVDFLGSKWVVESQIQQYLEDLNSLYLQYKQLLISKETLEGHEQLLSAIEKNLQARERFLSETEGMELEVIANYLDIDWTAEVEEHIIADFQKDVDLVTTDLQQWVEATSTLPFRLNEAWLNERSNARYYFRSDHIYIEYELQYAHVLLLGQVLQNDEGSGAKLILEAGFYNGFFLPEELLVEIPTIELSYSKVSELVGVVNPYFIQSNGGLELHSK